MIYTLTLNPALDYFVHLPALCPGEVNRTSKEEMLFGGKGVHVSLLLHALGVPSVAMGFVAGFTGKALEAAVQAMGIQTDFLTLPQGQTRINIKLKAQEETEINAGGPPVLPLQFSMLQEKLARLQAGDWLFLCGSLPHTLPDTAYAELMKPLCARGVHVAVDTSGAPLLHTLQFQPFVVKPNRKELSELLESPMQTEEALRAGAKALQAHGAQNVLVSLAGEGALLLTQDGDFHRAAAPGGVVQNSVGAGDSMLAGLLAGWLQTQTYTEALRWGIAAGSATAFSTGIACRSKIDELLHKKEETFF